ARAGPASGAPRKPGGEYRPGVLGGLDLERTAVPHDDAARYEQPQPQAGGLTIGARGRRGGRLNQGIEDHLPRVFWNRGPVVLHLHADQVRPSVRREEHRRILGAVLNRVVQKVAEDLLQPGAVESAV